MSIDKKIGYSVAGKPIHRIKSIIKNLYVLKRIYLIYNYH